MISDTELKQVAYVFKCTNSTLQIKGKINSITLGEWGKPSKLLLLCVQELKPPKSLCPDVLFFADNCKKLGLVFDDVVGIVEIINSRDVKVQVSELFSLLALEQFYFHTRNVENIHETPSVPWERAEICLFELFQGLG